MKNIPKMMHGMIELMELSPEKTIIEFNKMYADVKLYGFIKGKVGDEKKSISDIYSAINFVYHLRKENKNSWEKAYKISSAHYEIEEQDLRSIVGAKKSYKRRYI